MKTKNQNLSLLILLACIILMYSCRKSNTIDNVSQTNNETKASNALSQKGLFVDWIDQHKKGLNLKKINFIDSLKKNLDFSSLTVENRKNGDNLIIIPIKNEIRERLNLEENSLTSLLIVKSSSGKLRWSTIINFVPAEGKKLEKITENTIRNILNNTACQG